MSIKRNCKLLLLILSVLLYPVNAQDWKLVWSDEFNYTGHPDPNKWGYDVGNGGWGNKELENYTRNRTENARAENGNLIIEARRDWYDGIEYSSARLVTKNKGDWKYGRIEVRAKVPLGQGLWPAIWLLPTDWSYGDNYWPHNGEIDIMENYALNGIKPNTCEGNVHTLAYNHTIGTNKGATINTLSNVQDNYHVYAVSWYEDHIDFMVDNQTYFTFWNEGTWQTWPFDKRFHLILNVAVGGNLGTTPDPNIFPKQMIVDWVRVYQLSDGIEPTTGLVTAYRDDQFNNHSIGLNLGEYKLSDLEALGMNDNDISSLKVTEGYKAILFEHDNFSGESISITANTSNIGDAWNDKASSVKVITNGSETLEGTYFLKNRWSGLYMDATGGLGGTGNDVNIQQWNGTGAANQQLKFTHLQNGTYTLTFVHSNKVLDVAGLSKDNGANVIQYTYWNSPNEEFILVPTGDGYYKIIASHSGKLIEVTGENINPEANVQQWANVDQENGQWELIELNQTSLSSIESPVNSFKISQITKNSLNFSVVQSGKYRIKLFSINGKLINSIDPAFYKAGYNNVRWTNQLNSKNLYLCEIEGMGVKKIDKKIFK